MQQLERLFHPSVCVCTVQWNTLSCTYKDMDGMTLKLTASLQQLCCLRIHLMFPIHIIVFRERMQNCEILHAFTECAKKTLVMFVMPIINGALYIASRRGKHAAKSMVKKLVKLEVQIGA